QRGYPAFCVRSLILVFCVGCGPLVQRGVKVCPGAGSAGELLSELTAQANNARVWVNPPAEVYFQGETAFDVRGIVLGSNGKEYWLAIKPKEVSSYWWGRWSERSGFSDLKISPRILLEALGVTRIDSEEKLELAKEAGFDELTAREAGGWSRKVRVFNCSGRISEIEYLDAAGRTAAIVKLDKYIKVSEGFFIPGKIDIVTYGDEDTIDSFSLAIGSVKACQLNERQKEEMFNRPKPRGFEHVFRIIDGQIFEEGPGAE
ncbi:MAG: hypothetical protein ACYSQZ_04690, partial [Planctomycetota bacterium]